MEKILKDINSLELMQFNILPTDLEYNCSIDQLEKTEKILDEIIEYVENAITKKPKKPELIIITPENKINVCVS
jgi:hypothetical protein